jgi:uncharacterized protein
MNTGIFISSFVLGIGGSLHCLGMCGPLALAIPYNTTGLSKWIRLATYYFAKALAYAFMGAIFGLLGAGFVLMNWQQGLSIAAGIFILIWICFPLLKPVKGFFYFQRQFAYLYQALQRSPKVGYYFLLGLLNGVLPCGLVYTALAAATVSGGALQGFAAMFLFGIGTMPVLMAVVIFRQKVSLRFRRLFRPLSLVLSLSVGLLLILRGLNLGIPYLSPEFSDKQVKSCCHKP